MAGRILILVAAALLAVHAGSQAPAATDLSFADRLQGMSKDDTLTPKWRRAIVGTLSFARGGGDAASVLRQLRAMEKLATSKKVRFVCDCRAGKLFGGLPWNEMLEATAWWRSAEVASTSGTSGTRWQTHAPRAFARCYACPPPPVAVRVPLVAQSLPSPPSVSRRLTSLVLLPLTFGLHYINRRMRRKSTKGK